MAVTVDRTLKEDFVDALKIYTKLFPGLPSLNPFSSDVESSTSDSLMKNLSNGSASDEYQKLLRDAIAAFETAKIKLENMLLFSTNETAEDITTKEIPYLALDYYLATLVDRIKSTVIPARRPTVLRAKALYLSFLSLCDSYELLDRQSAKLLHQIQDTPITTPIYASANAQRYSDPASMRNAKIAKFKKERALEQQIAELDLRRRERGAGNTQDADEDNGDDEVARNLYFKQIELLVGKAFDALQGLDMELQILERAASQPQQSGPEQDPQQTSDERGRRRDDDNYSERVDPSLSVLNSAPILTSDGKVNRPFTIVSSREQTRQKVFGPGYVLPTMTIDEYLEEERRRGNIIEGGGAQSEIMPEKDDDNEAAADRETYRLREWDKFTEANPRGSGNTMNLG
ncbi:TAP42-like protein [Dipodascopsis uninucleata]